MTDSFQNIVFQTVISGVLVFALSQIIQEFFLKTIQRYRAIIGKIDNKLKFYANIIANPGVFKDDIIAECSKELRNLSCELEETYKQIPLGFIKKYIKTPEMISDSGERLIRLHNSLYKGDSSLKNSEDVQRIRENLNIPKL